MTSAGFSRDSFSLTGLARERSFLTAHNNHDQSWSGSMIRMASYNSWTRQNTVYGAQNDCSSLTYATTFSRVTTHPGDARCKCAQPQQYPRNPHREAFAGLVHRGLTPRQGHACCAKEFIVPPSRVPRLLIRSRPGVDRRAAWLENISAYHGRPRRAPACRGWRRTAQSFLLLQGQCRTQWWS